MWIEEPDPLWFELLKNRDKLISKNVTAMVSYARAQAYKYGDKGKRLDVFKDVVEWLESLYEYRKDSKLNWYMPMGIMSDGHTPAWTKIRLKHKEFISIHKKVNDTSEVEYLDVNGVMVPINVTVEYAIDVYKPRLEEYGARAKQAAADKGNDLKAIYHAVRIANQAEELLKTGLITLPRPEAPLLLRIRNGLMEEAEMKAVIDESFERVREAEKTNDSLRASPDKEWINDFLMDAHLGIIQDYENVLGEEIKDLLIEATKKFGW